jgi:rare lipoprotein A
MKRIGLVLLLSSVPLMNGCAHKQTQAKVPPAPQVPKMEQAPPAAPEPAIAESPRVSAPHSDTQEPSISSVPPEKPLYTEMGLASWYGPPYHNRRGANGEVYDMNQMTAAHRTLPLNTIVRVTNVKTGGSAIVRITDRGPFIGERMLDLSLAAAKAVDVWQPGTAWVKMEVVATPVPLDSGGKWEVQIGAFGTAATASELKQEIVDRYHPARVLEFSGPTGEWIRVRVQNDDRELAEEISRNLTTPEGGVFLVRLD